MPYSFSADFSAVIKKSLKTIICLTREINPDKLPTLPDVAYVKVAWALAKRQISAK
jgi:hypothetical protein